MPKVRLDHPYIGWKSDIPLPVGEIDVPEELAEYLVVNFHWAHMVEPEEELDFEITQDMHKPPPKKRRKRKKGPKTKIVVIKDVAPSGGSA